MSQAYECDTCGRLFAGQPRLSQAWKSQLAGDMATLTLEVNRVGWVSQL